MTDDEFIIELGKKMLEQMKNFQGTMIINPPQYKKYTEVVSFFRKLVDEFGGNVDVKLVPKEKHGYVTVEFKIVHLYGESLNGFIETLKKVDVFEIDPSNRDTIFIDINVNDVFLQIE